MARNRPPIPDDYPSIVRIADAGPYASWEDFLAACPPEHRREVELFARAVNQLQMERRLRIAAAAEE